MESQVEQQSRELPERIVLASLKPLEPQHWPFLLWKCTAGCSGPTATCCLFEWPLLLPASFLKTTFTVCASICGALFSRMGTTCSLFMLLILHLYFGSLLLYCVVPLCRNVLWTPHNAWLIKSGPFFACVGCKLVDSGFQTHKCVEGPFQAAHGHKASLSAGRHDD